MVSYRQFINYFPTITFRCSVPHSARVLMIFLASSRILLVDIEPLRVACRELSTVAASGNKVDVLVLNA